MSGDFTKVRFLRFTLVSDAYVHVMQADQSPIQTMKTAKEVKIAGHTYTVFECRNYGSGTTVPVKQIISTYQASTYRR